MTCPRVAFAPSALAVTGQREQRLSEARGWELLSVDAGALDLPRVADAPGWKAIAGARPVAEVDPGQDPARLDECDHLYRLRFAGPEAAGRHVLCLDGLATLADVWLNGRELVCSESMFVAHRLDVSEVLAADNELLLRFSALAPLLRERRERARWPTRLVSERHLRFFRTSLLGYTPGFCPEIKPVGPWRPIRLVSQASLAVEQVALVAGFDGGAATLRARLRVRWLGAGAPGHAEIAVGDRRLPLDIGPGPDAATSLAASASLPGVEPWWPHTSGQPARHAVSVRMEVGGERVEIDLGEVGFRSVEVEDGDLDRFRLRVNGERVFFRGACWTPLSLSSLHVGEASYREALEQVRDAGMNMLRVGGTTCYESDPFYRLCDELGVMVWQDMMFANMDYPADAAFRERATAELAEVLDRTALRCSLAVVSGGSEVQQQAAMMGRPREEWSHPLFDEHFPAACRERRPDLVYVPSSPCRGELPMHVAAGPSHYYGVGAYRRPLEDARLAGVRFAAECLAFANPASDTSDFGEVVRDRGAAWDFADVTAHYVERLFGPAALALREADPGRYAALARETTGHVMASVIGQLRRERSDCSGALVWFLRDLRAGAGFGLLDHRGTPKAAFFHLRRACQPRALWFVDLGLDGLSLELANDGPVPLSGRLSLELYHARGHVTDRAEARVELEARSQGAWNAEGLLGHFADVSYSYRFGPPETQVVLGRFAPDGGGPELLAFHLPAGPALPGADDLGLVASTRSRAGGVVEVTLRCERFAQSVRVDAPGFVASDDYFHLAPDLPHRLELTPTAGAELHGFVRPLNGAATALTPPGELA